MSEELESVIHRALSHPTWGYWAALSGYALFAIAGHILWTPVWRRFLEPPTTTASDPAMQQALAGAGEALQALGLLGGMLAFGVIASSHIVWSETA